MRDVKPFQIVGLLEMLQRYAGGFFKIGEILEILYNVSVNGISPVFGAKVAEGLPERLAEELDNLEKWCSLLNLQMSLKGIEYARITLSQNLTYDNLKLVIPELQRRVYDELESAWFLSIPPDRVWLYDNAKSFGDGVANKIPDVSTDIAEAGSCIATGRFTAGVFHLMRIMERGTQELGTKLGIQLTSEKNWHNILEEVNKAIRGLMPQNPQEKEARDRYSEASALLFNVKDAWRNRVMHPKQTYTLEEAEAVFNSVRTFIVHLVDKVL
jgi:hypothetical protein